MKSRTDWARKEKTVVCNDLNPTRCRCIALALALAGTFGSAHVRAQGVTPALEQPQEAPAPWALDDTSLFGSLVAQDSQQPSATTPAGTAANGQSPDASTPKTNPANPNTPPTDPATDPPTNPDDQYGKQPKRILGVIPNYRAVSANTHLPPQSFKEKFWLATQDTFDYSDFILVGALAGFAMAQKSQPAFEQGAAGYGRYYWHSFVDGGIENYMTEAIVPTLTREDPRYYTLGKGGFFKRSGYAVSRLFITRTDAGNKTFNISEVVGAGAAAGIANTYYPPQSNTFVKTYQRWGTEIGLDGVFDVLKEFWPDINHAVFRGKY